MIRSMKDRGIEEAEKGPYSEAYKTLDVLGKGAFGFVKLAERVDDKEQVQRRCEEVHRSIVLLCFYE